MILKYKYSGITEDGTEQVIADGFDSKGKALVSAMKSATHLRCYGNPRHFVRIEIEDDNGKPLDEYKHYDWLKCGKD